MEVYIDKVLLKYGHSKPMQPQIIPHKYREIKYGATQKISTAEDTRPGLDVAGLKIIQAIIGAILYYAQASENKLLV